MDDCDPSPKRKPEAEASTDHLPAAIETKRPKTTPSSLNDHDDHPKPSTDHPPSSADHRPPSNEKFILHISGLPKKLQNRKKLTSLLRKCEVPSFSKVNAKYRSPWALVTFSSFEDRETAKKKITQYCEKDEGLDLTVQDKMAKKFVPARDQGVALPKDIQSVVTPWADKPYRVQMIQKLRLMRKILTKVTKQIRKDSHTIPDWLLSVRSACCPMEGIYKSPVEDNYRNKVNFTIGLDVDGKPCVGFLLGKTKDGVIAVADPSECKNVSLQAKEVRELFQSYITGDQCAIPLEERIYCKIEKTGFYRTIMVRNNVHGETMVVIQASTLGKSDAQIDEEKSNILKVFRRMPLVVSLGFQRLDNCKSSVAPTDGSCPVEFIHGEPYIEEIVLGKRFRVSYSSFLQTNTPASEVLYKLTAHLCGTTGITTVFDVCCGTGTIGLTMAEEVDRVVGVDIVEDAIEDAKLNAKLNNIENATFVAGKAEEQLKSLLSDYKSTNCVAVVDPPRVGLHREAAVALRCAKYIGRVVYICCKHSTMPANASALCRPMSKKLPGEPFVPVRAIAVDMFPHTDQFELVMVFERKVPGDGGDKDGEDDAEDVSKLPESLQEWFFPNTMAETKARNDAARAAAAAAAAALASSDATATPSEAADHRDTEGDSATKPSEHGTTSADSTK